MPTATEVAKAWIAYWQQELETGKFPDSDDGYALTELVLEQPDQGWAAILTILERIDAEPSSRLFQVLAAGPLEDLLAHHGDSVVDLVEAEAKRNPRFKLLLGGVWQNAMSDHVWSRVQACRSATW